MAQVVPAEVGDPGSLEDFFPRRLKSGGDIKETRSGSGLLAPAPQHAHGFVIERHMPGLAILGIPALDGEEPTAEVDGTPTQLDHRRRLTASRRSPPRTALPIVTVSVLR